MRNQTHWTRGDRRSLTHRQTPDEDISIAFQNLYDGNEREELFTGDMKLVPSDGRDFSSWLTIITHFDEHEEGGKITADVVYLNNPQVQVIVRVKAMVADTNIGSAR